MAWLYANENLPPPVVEALSAAGHDVLTSYESGRAGQAVPDADVLKFAIDLKRILVTLNMRHFIRLHTENPDHAGIIVCTVDPDSAALAERIDSVLHDHPDMAGMLIRVNRPA